MEFMCWEEIFNVTGVLSAKKENHGGKDDGVMIVHGGHKASLRRRHWSRDLNEVRGGLIGYEGAWGSGNH